MNGEVVDIFFHSISVLVSQRKALLRPKRGRQIAAILWQEEEVFLRS